MKIELFSYPTAKPFAWLGLTHPFFDVNITTLGYTWLAMASCLMRLSRWKVGVSITSNSQGWRSIAP